MVPKELFSQYREELEKKYYINTDQTVEETLKLYKPRHYTHILIYDGNQLAGFLITSAPPDCHPDCDYFICEAFVKPEHRKKGLMTDTIRKYISEHPGIYCLDVLFQNSYARNFWFKTFRKMRYTNITLPFIEHGITGICDTLFFAPNFSAAKR